MNRLPVAGSSPRSRMPTPPPVENAGSAVGSPAAYLIAE